MIPPGRAAGAAAPGATGPRGKGFLIDKGHSSAVNSDPFETHVPEVHPGLADTISAVDHPEASTVITGEPQTEEHLRTAQNAGLSHSRPEKIIVGECEILESIAQGGMGVVYKARQRRLNRVVALKMIRSGELAGIEEVQRFLGEAEHAARLDHPNIVPIYEVGEHSGQPYFTMGYVDGESLAARLTRGPVPPDEATALLLKIARAVAYAHGRGIVHRDLKPANILVDAAGEPRITDFGLAKRADSEDGLTVTGQILGTPSYMSPEQAVGRTDAVGPLSDVYSLGAVLYDLLTARAPFRAASAWATVAQVIEEDPVPPRLLNSAVDTDLQTICLKCLQKNPLNRYGSADELADELERRLRGEPIVARPVSDYERLKRWCRRKPALAIAIGLAIAGILATVVTLTVALVMINRSRNAAVELAETNGKLLNVFQLERDGLVEQIHNAEAAVATLRQERDVLAQRETQLQRTLDELKRSQNQQRKELE